MVCTITQFNRLDVSRFSVESEVIIKTPGIGTKTTCLGITWGDFTFIARLIRDLQNRNEVLKTIGIIGFWE